MKHKKISIGLLIAFTVFSVGAYAQTARVVWVQNRLAPESIAPGESKSFVLTLQNNGPEKFETEHVSIVVDGDVSSVLTIKPTSFPKNIKKGDSVSVRVDVSIPTDMPLQVLSGSISLIRTDDDVNESKKVFLTQSLPVEITASSILLPPDPKEEGKQTVLGIDIGGPEGIPNGVRDDIDRYIVFTYPHSEKTRMALTQYAAETQKVFADVNDKQKTIENSRKQLKALDCLEFVLDYNFDVFDTASSLIEVKFINTPARSRVDIRANGHFGGQGIHSYSKEEDKAACHINPDILQN